MNSPLKQSNLPSHYSMQAGTKQAGKGQWINHIPYQ